MKGGKGGIGRKRTPVRPLEKPKAKPRDLARKGDTKKDWGAIPRDDDGARKKPK